MTIKKLTAEEEAEFEAYLAWELENNHPLVALEVVGPYTLHLTFDDGLERTIDFKPVLWGKTQAYLFDLAFFNQAYINRDGILSWPPEPGHEMPGAPAGTPTVDFNPAYLYCWPEVVEELTERARAWHEQQAKREGLQLTADSLEPESEQISGREP
jgi:hypothetical protein